MSLDRVKLIKNFFNGLQNNEETNFIGDLLLYLSNISRLPLNKNETSINTVYLLLLQTLSKSISKNIIQIFNKKQLTNIPENSLDQFLFRPIGNIDHYNIIKIGAFTGDNRNDNVMGIMKEVKEKNLNFRNIYIEPVKEYLDLLMLNNKKIDPQNNHIYINKAVSNDNKKLKIYKVSKNNNFDNYPWWIEQLATSNKEHYIKHGFKDILLDEIEVDCVTFNDIVKEYEVKSLDLLVIDTEGHDYNIIMSLDFNLIKPKYIEFEHLHMTHFEYKKCIEKLEKEGYFIVLERLDDIRLIYSKFKD